MKRPYADLIKKWADDDSLVVQFYDSHRAEWVDTQSPSFSEYGEYRIKPKEFAMHVRKLHGLDEIIMFQPDDKFPANVMFRFGDDGKLLDVEIL